MNKQVMDNEDTIDLLKLFNALIRRIWLIMLAAIIFGAGAFIGTKKLITPMYQSDVMFYVNNSSINLSNAALSVTSGDLSAAKSLVDSYIVILNARTTLEDVIDYAGVEMTPGQLKNEISASAVNKTEIFRVTVTDADPVLADKLADSIAFILPKKISNIIDGTSAKIVDSSIVAAKPCSPNTMKNTMMGVLLGVAISCGLIMLEFLMDNIIRTAEEFEQICKYPLLAEIPDMEEAAKSGYSYGYSRESKKQSKKNLPKTESDLIGNKISFAASEAYKTLRTKVQFSFADDKNCHIIGMSSAMPNEGKSITSVNLAYAMAQLEKKVLIIDADMRKPTLAQKIGVNKYPGLSNYLINQVASEKILQKFDNGEGTVFDVITAGKNPPNPMELLSSSRMQTLLDMFRDKYDYIIIDLPPVCEVSDAMVVSKMCDGMVLVSRQDYCVRQLFSEAVAQFEFAGAKVLGIAFNCTKDNGVKYTKYYKKAYGKYGRYSRYYRRDNKNSENKETVYGSSKWIE